MDDENLIGSGQGRSAEELEDSGRNVSVCTVGCLLVILAALLWSFLLSGCAVDRVFPEPRIRKMLNGGAK